MAEQTYKKLPPKDPEAKLDYIFDWAPLSNNTGLTDWLRPAEQIDSFEVTVQDGLTKVSAELVFNNTAVWVWLDGGTNNTEYLVSCKIVTDLNREDKRSVLIPVKNR